MPPDELAIEAAGESEQGPCGCCGNRTRRVWGYVNAGDRMVAAYFVEWTLTRVDDHGANFDLIVGPWGDGSSPADRQAVAVEFRRIDGTPQFMVVDAADRPAAQSTELVERALTREQVVGTPLAPQVFALLDAIWLGEARIHEITSITEGT